MTVPIFIVDASVLLKWYLSPKEPNWGEADLLFGRFGSGKTRVIVPEYAIYELANRFTQMGPQGAKWIELAAWHLSDRVPLELGFLAESMELVGLARRQGISKATLYDALYVQLAKKTGYPLLTADRIQGQMGEWAGVEVTWLWRYV